jgi:hypothetical protein
LFCAILLLDAAAGRFDLLARTRAHLDTANGYGAIQITIGKHLCRAFPGSDQSSQNQRISRDFGSGRKALLEIAQTNDLMLDPKDIRETTLWQPPRERHLSTLELRLSAAWSVVSRACLHTLVSLTRRLTGA